jgi:hypothetical protein
MIRIAILFSVLITSAASANISKVTAVGQSFESGLGKEIARKRAIADALENFLIESGGTLRSSVLSQDGVIVFDQTLFNSDKRLIGYDVVGFQEIGNITEATVSITYQNKLDLASCSKEQKFKFNILPAEISFANNVPPVFTQFQSHLMENVESTLSTHAAIFRETFNPEAIDDLDYTSLLRANSTKQVASDTLKISGQLTYDTDNELIKFQSIITTNNHYLQPELVSTSTTASARERGNLKLLYRSFSRDGNKVFDELSSDVLTKLKAALATARCKPKSAMLTLLNDEYVVQLGSSDGIDENTVFLLENGQPHAFKVRKVYDRMSTVQSLSSNQSRTSYLNKWVYVLE